MYIKELLVIIGILLFPHETPIFILSYQRNRMLGIETRHLH